MNLNQSTDHEYNNVFQATKCSACDCLLNKEIMHDETSYKYLKVLKKYLEVLVKMVKDGFLGLIPVFSDTTAFSTMKINLVSMYSCVKVLCVTATITKQYQRKC